MATRLMSRSPEDLSPQLGDASGPPFAPLGSIERRQQTPRVSWRPEQVSGLNQPGKFAGRNESHISRPSPPNNHGLLPIHNLIQNAGQVVTQPCIRGFGCHQPPALLCRIPVRSPFGRNIARGYLCSDRRPAVISAAALTELASASPVATHSTVR